MARRDAILEGIAAANELHDELNLRDRLISGTAPVDVFSTIEELGVSLLFKSLEGLLGLYIPGQTPGILVTTRRNLHIQRYTAAHELGHHVLEHRTPSFDDDVGFVARGNSKSDFQEDAADAFAAEFLLPRWLLISHLKRQSWNRVHLEDPQNVYQLSLRVGLSYEATCWSLLSHKLVSRRVTNALLEVSPRKSKQQVLWDIQPDSWYPDVWLLSKHDDGIEMVAGSDDIVVLIVEEHVSGGFCWNFTPTSQVRILIDDRQTGENKSFGGAVNRRIVFQSDGYLDLQLEERQAWNPTNDPIGVIHISASFLGKESGGKPRRRQLAA